MKHCHKCKTKVPEEDLFYSTHTERYLCEGCFTQEQIKFGDEDDWEPNYD